MKTIPVTEAVGLPLCHDMTAIRPITGKEVAFRRGHVLQAEDIPVLLSMGKTRVFVGELEANQIHEEEAGLAGAQTLAGSRITISGPSEGKFTLFSAGDGLFTIHREALRALNGIPDYTAATIPGNTPVRAGDVLAGVRIVPLFTHGENVSRVLALRETYGGPILSVRPFFPLRVGFVITGSEVYSGRIGDRFAPILGEKVGQFGGEVLGVHICPDDSAHINRAIMDFLEQGAELILFTGGMSVDPDDVTPTAIRQTGAEVIFQGVPLQPGNMLMLATLGACTLIGVPGAAMHRKITALDVLLPRIFAGDYLDASDLRSLGEGGLCLDCQHCTYPACYFGRQMQGP